MKKSHLPLIIFFMAGASLTPEEAEEAHEITHCNVVYRNLRFVVKDEGAKLEKCDGVAGDVPEIYEDLPTPEEAVEAFQEKFAEKIAEHEEAQAAASERDRLAFIQQAKVNVRKAEEHVVRAEERLEKAQARLEAAEAGEPAPTATEKGGKKPKKTKKAKTPKTPKAPANKAVSPPAGGNPNDGNWGNGNAPQT